MSVLQHLENTMLLVESNIRDFMLDSQVEPTIAAQVAHSLDGTLSTGIADADGQIRFDGAVKADKWPAIAQQLRAVPASMISIDDVPSGSGGLVQFTVCVNEGPMSNSDTQDSFDMLRVTHSDDAVDELDALIEDDEEII